jgi:hypothetical protein
MGDIVNFADRRAERRRRALFGELRLVPKVERALREIVVFEPTSNAATPDDAANDAGDKDGS